MVGLRGSDRCPDLVRVWLGSRSAAYEFGVNWTENATNLRLHRCRQSSGSQTPTSIDAERSAIAGVLLDDRATEAGIGHNEQVFADRFANRSTVEDHWRGGGGN
jgi:hypothetical protein